MAIKISSAIGGGLLGALALTLLHEGVRKIDKENATIDSLGMNALSKILKGFRDSTLTEEQELFELTHTGEVLSNALYFSIAGLGSKKNLMLRSALLGLTAGLGALVLPRYLGIEENGRSNKSKILTISRYLLGSLLTATTIKTMEKNGKKLKASAGSLLKEHPKMPQALKTIGSKISKISAH
jgi:hypothetical protein